MKKVMLIFSTVLLCSCGTQVASNEEMKADSIANEIRKTDSIRKMEEAGFETDTNKIKAMKDSAKNNLGITDNLVKGYGLKNKK